ncbi:cobyrinate a,c-diamide synthase [Histidinibacterium lentulum]|uniref:Hydrogenobyrinate a,c-diamide synthase n=1 Tax=Histidinibacterium lentulum TaxID=2480588 RepID=A0A3N2RA14_9RHOB|nr:cobyrinate a,c-diamide synthase [Histidinibacterium lentulum]ROU04268.1 cobyrinate a,c-diamide synthase [Histidinibacterium lentulum]
MPRGLVLAAPSSGSGKTTVTLGLLRALSRRGIPVRGAKSGPDYIDPAFHGAACGVPSVNLDAWAMTPDRLRALASGEGLLLIEGAMGLFDGAPPEGRGATADLARLLGLPVILVVDAARQSHSVAALVRGFRDHDPSVRLAGVLLNRVGSPRHEAMLRAALSPLGLPVLGALPRNPALALPERHLGLVQAAEHPALEAFLEDAAASIADHIDLSALIALAAPFESAALPPRPRPRHIAVARDAAFSFLYPHLLRDWHEAGTRVRFFSPLADEPVPGDVDLVYLPGGYPELHAARLAAAKTFMHSLKDASQITEIYGECGGYMTLGESLTDAEGTRHRMAGLLGLATSFAERRLHLGYRRLTPLAGPFKTPCTGHEFHYATTLGAEGPPLWRAEDAEGTPLPDMGLCEGRVSGSFAHIIDMT